MLWEVNAENDLDADGAKTEAFRKLPKPLTVPEMLFRQRAPIRLIV